MAASIEAASTVLIILGVSSVEPDSVTEEGFVN